MGTDTEINNGFFRLSFSRSPQFEEISIAQNQVCRGCPLTCSLKGRWHRDISYRASREVGEDAGQRFRLAATGGEQNGARMIAEAHHNTHATVGPLFHWCTAGDDAGVMGPYSVALGYRRASYADFPGAHVIHESCDAASRIRFSAGTSRHELAEELHSRSEYVTVLGASAWDVLGPLQLRDGDIVHDSCLSEYPQQAYWEIAASHQRSRLAPFLLSWFFCLSSARQCLLWLPFLQCQSGLLVGAVRSRSPSRSSDTDIPPSPRVGAWRPDHPRPMAAVTHGRCHYNVCSPFHGVGPPAYFTQDATSACLDDLVRHYCGGWCRSHVLQAPTTARSPLILLPVGVPDFATVLVFTQDQMRALLVPRKLSLRELRAFVERCLHSGGSRLVLPPALQRYELPSLQLSLRDGDSFEWLMDQMHPFFRSPPATRHRHICWLPHLNCWQSTFEIEQGDWVYIWRCSDCRESQCERRWVAAGSKWSPRVLQFLRPRTIAGPQRWVPSAYHEDGKCHFVHQTPVGYAHILLHRPLRGQLPECRLCEDSFDPEMLEGWQLAPSLAGRGDSLTLRDGDVLIPAPTITGIDVSGPLAVALTGGFRPGGVSALVYLSLGLMHVGVSAMFSPPEGHTAPLLRVGKFPWRVPVADRALHDSVYQGRQINATAEVSPDDTVEAEEIRMALTGSEPDWSHVWPSPVPDQIIFLPVAPAPSLVCVLVMSPDWHLPLLIPRRADLGWLTAYLRSTSPGPILSALAPIASRRPRGSQYDAIQWRDGDLILAFPTDVALSAIEMPSFPSSAGDCALWQLDFGAKAWLMPCLLVCRSITITIGFPALNGLEARQTACLLRQTAAGKVLVAGLLLSGAGRGGSGSGSDGQLPRYLPRHGCRRTVAMDPSNSVLMSPNLPRCRQRLSGAPPCVTYGSTL